MNISILYEDSDLIAVDKPPGIVVNNAESVKGETVQDWAARRMPNDELRMTNETKVDDFYSRAGIVHRLDKETSGILLIAKTPQAFSELQRQFKERLVHKTYLALCHGRLEPPEGEIRAPVGRLAWNRERFGIVPGGKEAVTKYKAVSCQQSAISNEYTTLVELYPETGRTHQIRVHLKYINHPIVGDYLYAGRKTSRSDREEVGRVMLHAWKIEFAHPTKGDTLQVEAPVPEDMKKFV